MNMEMRTVSTKILYALHEAPIPIGVQAELLNILGPLQVFKVKDIQEEYFAKDFLDNWFSEILLWII